MGFRCTGWRAAPAAFGLLLALAGCGGLRARPPTGATVQVAAQPDSARTVTVFYEEGGASGPEAPALLVFHGGPGVPDARLFAQPYWRALASVARIVRFDQRGAGRSGALAGRAAEARTADDYLVERTVADALAVADAALGRERRLVLHASSFGALPALLLAARAPERVAALILVSPLADGRFVWDVRARLTDFLERLVADDPRAAADLRAIEARLATGRLGDGRGAPLTRDTWLFETVAAHAYRARDHAALKALLHEVARRGALPAPPTARPASHPTTSFARTGASLALFRTVACRELGWARVSAANCAGVPGPFREPLDALTGLGAFDRPALILAARLDPLLPPADAQTLALRLGPRAELVFVGAAGHPVASEQPALAAAETLRFLRRAGLLAARP